MNHRRMIRYRRHRGYGASALSFVTACWNGLWKEILFYFMVGGLRIKIVLTTVSHKTNSPLCPPCPLW